jgi:hypothetical protein
MNFENFMTRAASDNAQREREIAQEHMTKSKRTMDHHWRKAQMYTGRGDYLEADHGEAPQGARW